MREKIRLFQKKHPKSFIIAGIIVLFLIFFFLFLIIDQHEVGSYVHLILLILFLIAFLFYTIKIYRDIFIPFIEPYIKKHGRLFTFLLLILPIWISSFYLTFLVESIDMLPTSVTFVIRSIGGIGIVFSVIITSFWIKTDFKDREDNQDFKNVTLYKKNIEDVGNAKANFGVFLKNPNFWIKFLNDERSKLYFDKTGKLLPNLKINDSIIVASLIHKLKKHKLFIEDYNTRKLNEIADASFNIKSAIGRRKLIDYKLFDWISELQ